MTAEAAFLSPQDTKARNPKRKSPPSVSFPISCRNCFENSEEFLKVDFEAKKVICKKCNHQATSDEYDQEDFVKACLYDKKESSSSGFKKHAETAYLSCLADVKRADNEKSLISLREKEMNLKLVEQERADKLEEKRQATQEQLLKMQTEAAAAMNEIVHNIIKKSPLDKYREQKASIAAMLAAGDISSEVANQLMEKLNADLLSANLI